MKHDIMPERGENMRDFPVFTTENGVGSLVLKEIPYSGNAYIKIQSSLSAEAFLTDCLDFCKMAGAVYIYACGDPVLERYPFHTAILKMQADTSMLPQCNASLFPVTEKTAEQWRTIYNDKMRNVPNSSYVSMMEMIQLCKEGSAYFVHREGQLIGIGKASYGKIDAVISLIPGAGEQVVCALAHGICGDHVELEVASTNLKAIVLYERLGFVKSAELSRWYLIK